MTKEDFMQAMQDDIDPMKYAGEGWFDTSEYARKEDIGDPFVRNDVGKEGDYYPPVDIQEIIRKQDEEHRKRLARSSGRPMEKADLTDPMIMDDL
jgi:hypothetical protein